MDNFLIIIVLIVIIYFLNGYIYKESLTNTKVINKNLYDSLMQMFKQPNNYFTYGKVLEHNNNTSTQLALISTYNSLKNAYNQGKLNYNTIQLYD